MLNNSAVTADQINTVEKARMQLFDCSTRAEAEGVFSRFNISDIEARTTLLNRCMQVQDAYGIPGDNPVSKEDFYEETLAFFEDGQWRKLI